MGRVTIPSWLTTTDAPHLRCGTVHYKDLECLLGASLRVLALELGITKFKSRLMIYAMCQMPPGANLYILRFLTIIINNNQPHNHRCTGIKDEKSSVDCSCLAPSKWLAHGLLSSLLNHHTCGSSQSCTFLECSTTLRTWLLVSLMIPLLLLQLTHWDCCCMYVANTWGP